MKAIETSYCGYRFRSRLEARWAVFFQTLGLKWEYEPEGFDLGFGVWYLPDFRVWYPGRGGDEGHYVWFEVKPDLRRMTPEEWQKVVLFDRETSITLLDGPPAETVYARPTDFFEVWTGEGRQVFRPGFIPSEKDLEDFQNLKWRDGEALWSGKGRMWCDNAIDVFHEDPTQSTIGEDAMLAIRKAVRAAREFNMHGSQRGAA